MKNNLIHKMNSGTPCETGNKSPQRILVLGSSGSGKSTFSVQLGKAAGLPVIHLDQLFWRPGWESVSNEEFDALLDQELEKECWIMDGNYGRTMQRRIDRCDTILYFDLPRRVCLLSVLKRIWTHHGTTRPDMGDDCPERFDWAFIKWIWTFNKKHRQTYLTILKSQTEKNVYVIKSRKELPALLEELSRRRR